MLSPPWSLLLPFGFLAIIASVNQFEANGRFAFGHSRQASLFNRWIIPAR